jgi:hypothetical protein
MEFPKAKRIYASSIKGIWSQLWTQVTSGQTFDVVKRTWENNQQFEKADSYRFFFLRLCHTKLPPNQSYNQG